MQPDDPRSPGLSPDDQDCPDLLRDLTEAQILEVHALRIDWFLYVLWRQTCSHDEVLALLAADDPPKAELG